MDLCGWPGTRPLFNNKREVRLNNRLISFLQVTLLLSASCAFGHAEFVFT